MACIQRCRAVRRNASAPTRSSCPRASTSTEPSPSRSWQSSVGIRHLSSRSASLWVVQYDEVRKIQVSLCTRRTERSSALSQSIHAIPSNCKPSKYSPELPSAHASSPSPKTRMGYPDQPCFVVASLALPDPTSRKDRFTTLSPSPINAGS